MSFLVIAVALGLVGASYAYRTRLRALLKCASPTTAKESSPASPALDQEMRQALYRHAAAIESFVDRSSHPRELFDDPDFQQAVALLSRPDIPADVLRQYAIGPGWQIACAALTVLEGKPDPELTGETLIARLPHMRPWTVYFALRCCAAMTTRPPTGAPFTMAQYWWPNIPVMSDMFSEYLDLRQQRGDPVSFGNALDAPHRAEIKHIKEVLDGITHPAAATLGEQLREWQEHRVDRTLLATVGRLWEEDKEEDLLIVPDVWRDQLAAASSAVLKTPRRSVLVAGESRVGKTVFLRLVGQSLAREGWTVFEASGAELMAGQSYFGQLEERIRTVIRELDARKRIVWYVPDLLELAQSGRHQGQSASILDQIFSAVSAGTLVILSETSPSGLARLFLQRSSLRGALEICRLSAMSEAETAGLVRQVAGRIASCGSVTVTEQAIDSVLYLSHQYLGLAQLPGITVDLLKRSVNHAVSAERNIIVAEDVLDTLSQLSGLPRAVLDDDQRLDLDAVRHEFGARVIGQGEAVNAIIDRIAMLKAGLVDPRRPIGVFLFAGPTGTGKTELAKTLAAYLFGSPDRMTRLDMSEFQTAESTAKILGTSSGDADSLTEKVRKQPFSVVLLDEFEKAHSNVWDLFLQVFDDGRLTDVSGRLVNFNHTIIILTTNLGATTHQSSVFGFGRERGAYSADQVLKAVGQTFRPEFVNRLDKIIVFRPLSRAFMRQILEKELALVLQRRGLRQREWVVEWEDSALAFLLDRGFSPDMGARPLRRAIDEYLLAPLAATMVEHRYPAGDQFLFVRSDGNAIQVKFVDPDAEDDTVPVSEGSDGDEISLARIILNPRGDEAERQWLLQDWGRLAQRLASSSWTSLKDGLFAQSGAADIWQRTDRLAIFSRIELIERVGEAARTAERLSARLLSARSKGAGAARELAARCALQLHLVGLGIQDAELDAPVDAALSVESVLGSEEDAGGSARWRHQIMQMYRDWAGARHMKLIEIAPTDGKGPAIFQITGFGAWHTLQEEAGLHVLEIGEGGPRHTVRVRVVPGPPNSIAVRDAYGPMAALLERAGDNSAVTRRYRSGAASLVRDARHGWRSGNFNAVLAGNFDLIAILKSV